MQRPLGYVFWHWPRPGAGLGRYGRKLAVFQRSLRAHGPEGLIEALSFRAGGLPWANGRKTSFEDWYVVADFGALGALNDAAVGAANKASHDDVAREAFGSVGGLYKRLQGGLSLGDARFATWLRKPAGTDYPSFFDRLEELVRGRKTDLWQRQLVLGPSPEFCLHSRSRVDLPRSLGPLTVRVGRVESGGGLR